MLNSRQQEAVNQIDWPLLIIAWAGSWKTKTLTSRVEYMIREKWIAPSSIFCVTFTNKAWWEMKERMAQALWTYAPRYLWANNFPLVWTFHGIWVYILKEKIETIGYKKDFTIYDETDKKSIIKEILKNKWYDEKLFPPAQIWYHISAAKNSLISPETYQNQWFNELTKVVSEAYFLYEKRLRQLNALDFDDILINTLRILEKPENLEFYQNKFKYFMVDEYQDTNAPQYKIIKLLASKTRNLCVVWDDWQSIYSWRWADMTNILNFEKDYPEAKIVKLEQNYRSTKNIIWAANNLIKNNKNAREKTLFTDNVEGEKIQIIKSYDDRAEAKTISEIIKEKWTYSDNLVLYRTNTQSRAIEEAFMRSWIPYQVIWWMKFYDRAEIKDMIAYLKILKNPSDVVAFKRIINVPARKIWPTSQEVLFNYSSDFDLNPAEVIENVDEIDELKPMARNSIKIFNMIYKKLYQFSRNNSVSDLIAEIYKLTSYEDHIKAKSASKEEQDSKRENVKELENVASQFNWMEPLESLTQFLEEIALVSDLDNKEEETDKVTLMTIHTSKWLESPRVFIAGLEENLFPHQRSLAMWESSKELEEERRLMYVAITRAKEELYISKAEERFSFWSYIRNKESRFLNEILEDYKENYITENPVSKNIFSDYKSNSFGLINDWPPSVRVSPISKNTNNVSDFPVWTRVEHPKFWIWVIISLSGDLWNISFWAHWTKKMSIKVAPIKKIW